MNCLDAEGLFDAYLDGELSGTLRLEFDTHRLHCPVCQQKLSLLETTEYVISSDLRGPSLSDDFTDKLMASIQQRKMEPHPLRLRRPLVAAAVVLQAAAVVAFVALLPKWWNRPQPAPAPTINLADLRPKINELHGAGDKEGLIALIQGAVEQGGNARAGLARDVSTVRDWAWSLELPGFGNGISLSSLLQSIFGITPAESTPERPADAAGRGSI